MRFTGLALSLFAVLLLSSCGSIYDSPHQHSDFSNWVMSRPSHLEQYLGTVPGGYSGEHGQEAAQTQEAPRVIKPLSKVDSSDGSVTVFPLDGSAQEPQIDMTQPVPVQATAQDSAQNAVPSASGDYGHLADQLFFAHGSSAISAAESRGLGRVAAKVKKSAAPVAVTVVGHASKRVDRAVSLERKKIINFEMAQKRADAVVRVLDRAGVTPNWVEAVSKGDAEPDPTPGRRTQEAADRRVDVFTNSQ